MITASTSCLVAKVEKQSKGKADKERKRRKKRKVRKLAEVTTREGLNGGKGKRLTVG